MQQEILRWKLFSFKIKLEMETRVCVCVCGLVEMCVGSTHLERRENCKRIEKSCLFY